MLNVWLKGEGAISSTPAVVTVYCDVSPPPNETFSKWDSLEGGGVMKVKR